MKKLNPFTEAVVLLLLIILGNIQPNLVGASEQKSCKALEIPRNVEMSCMDETSKPGYIEHSCSYKCKHHYTPHESTSGTAKEHTIVCGQNGEWNDLQKFNSFTCREDCGRTPLKSQLALVVHGKTTNSSSWPWHASVFQKIIIENNETIWAYICGGSLVRDSVILTAAHCVTLNGKLVDAELFKIVLGAETSIYSLAVGNRNAQEFLIKRIFISPNYDSKVHDGDIALLHLEGQGVRYSDYIIPVCLPNDGAIDLNAIAPGRAGDVVGFGNDERGKLSLTLKHAELTIASPAECFNSLNRIISVSQFCAGNKINNEQWVTVCNGDSGGGFVVPSAIHQRYFIHGIVSTGDASSNRYGGVCRNHVVFTRVFQYIFWVRDVLERIHGEIIRELTASAKYPYILTGTEINYAQFTPIPRQWDNLVTSIRLEYANVEPEVLFQSLQQNAGLETLNLTHVRLTGEPKAGRSFLLPHLKTFVLDIPVLDCWEEKTSLNVLGCINKDPSKISQVQLKSLLFFYKHEADWPIENIFELNTNTMLTIHTSKILQIDLEAGRLVCQTQFCSELLAKKGDDQLLKHLALRNCELNLDRLLVTSDRTFAKLRVLVLEKVMLKGGELSDILRESPELETLSLSMGSSIAGGGEDFRSFRNPPQRKRQENSISLELLPKSLKHLSCMGTSIKLDNQKAKVKLYRDEEPIQHVSPLTEEKSQIVFPNGRFGTANSRVRGKRAAQLPVFPLLETFVCDSCELDDIVSKNLHTILPNLKRLVFVGQQKVNITNLLVEMTQLKHIVFINVEIEELPDESNSDTFIGLDKFRADEDTASFLISRASGSWRRSKLKTRAELLLHRFFGLENFHTSFEELETDARLTSFEKAAYNTGKYSFRPSCRGSLATSKCDKFVRMPKIPQAVQGVLKVVEVKHVEIIPEELLQSLQSAYELESLILDQVRLLGYFVNFIELPSLRHYRLHAITGSENFVDQTSAVYGVKLYIPFGKGSDGSQGGTRRYAGIPATTEGSRAYLDSFEIEFNKCKLLSLDYVKGEFISTPRVAGDILPHLKNTNLTTIALRLSENQLNDLSIPASAEYLDLRCKSEYEWNCSRVLTNLHNLIAPVRSLKELRLAPHHVFDEHQFLGRTKFKLEDIGGSASTLQLLGIDEAHFQSSQSIPNFKKLETVLFETCSFDPQIMSRFFEVFNTVKTVGILSYGYEKYGVEAKARALEANREILLAATKNLHVEKIVGNLGSIEDVKGRGVQDELDRILASAGVRKEHLNDFVLKRDKNGTWVSGSRFHITFEEELRTLRGDPIFGDRSCIQRLF